MGIVWSGANFLGHPTSSSFRINFCLDSQNINNLLKMYIKNIVCLIMSRTLKV